MAATSAAGSRGAAPASGSRSPRDTLNIVSIGVVPRNAGRPDAIS